jgi:ribosomal protein S18 acetylase RimI-like enzyme
MQVSLSNNLTFTSLANPIKSYKLKTDLGQIDVREINYIHQPDKSFLKKIAGFFLDNFADASAHPYWQSFKKSNRNQEIYDNYVENEAKNIHNALNSRDTTILVARDKFKNIIGAIYAKKLHEGNKVVDCNTLYIDSLAVDSKYRGQDIGASLLKSVLESSKKRFTDAFLIAYREAVPFYYKLGFKSLGYKKPQEFFVISEMARYTDDYPRFVDYLTLNLNNTLPVDWCTRVVRRNIPKG